MGKLLFVFFSFCLLALVGGQQQCGGVRLITRSEWGAREPTCRDNLTTPVPRVFIHHSAGTSCSSEEHCISQVRAIQNYHMDSNGWCDIGYNFLIGEDGNAYEGRGWWTLGAHVTSYNTVSIGICQIGTYTNRTPNDIAISAMENLIACSVEVGSVQASYCLHGHRDGGSTECPGQSLYDYINATYPQFCGPITNNVITIE